MNQLKKKSIIVGEDIKGNRKLYIVHITTYMVLEVRYRWLKKVIHTRDALSENELVEVKIWEVSKSEDFPHGLKYSFNYIKNKERVLAYDNERGKNHHRHFKGKETKIEFEEIWKLLRKFKEEVAKLSKK